MTITSTDMRIYVADLAAYNNGRLHGVWIDLEGRDADDVQEIIADMLRQSPYPNVMVDCPACNGPRDLEHDPNCQTCKGTGQVPSAEEWAIHDYEGFEGFRVSEFADIESLCKIAELTEKHDGAFLAFLGHTGDLEEAANHFEDAYQGTWNTLEAFCENWLEETGQWEEVPEWAKPYFDMEAYANSCENGGEVFTCEAPDYQVYVFRVDY